MVPGVETFGAALNPSPGLVFFFSRGGPNSEGRFNVNGMPVANAFAGGGGSSLDLRHRERRRNRVHGRRRHGRDRRGRTGAQHRPAVGRQHVPGTGLHQLFERRTAGQQPHAGTDGADARAEPPRDAGHHQGVRRQHLLWRAHRARSPVVLRQLSEAEHRDRRRGRRRKRERVRPLEMGLGGGSEPDRPHCRRGDRSTSGASRRRSPRNTASRSTGSPSSDATGHRSRSRPTAVTPAARTGLPRQRPRRPRHPSTTSTSRIPSCRAAGRTR